LSLPIPLPSITEAKDLLEYLRNKWFLRNWKKAVQAQIRARAHPYTYEFLKRIYGKYPGLSVDGVDFPVAMIRAPESQWENPESALVRPLAAEVRDYDELALMGGRHLDRLKRLSRTTVLEKDGTKHPPIKLYEGHGYRMLSLEADKQVQLECCPAWYTDQIRTCDSLQWELLTAIGSMVGSTANASRRAQTHLSDKSAGKLFRSLPLRTEAHAKSANGPVVNGHGRSANIGVCTLVVFNDGRGYSALIRERSERVAVYREALDGVPSFMFGSEVGDVTNEYSIMHNVYREYMEELFDMSELENPKGPVAFDWFYGRYPELQYLMKLLRDKNEAELLFTGVAIDLFNLRPDILMLMLIRTPQWWKIHEKDNPRNRLMPLKFNYEFKTQRELSAERRDIIVRIELNEKLEPKIARLPTDIKLSDRSIWVPTGAAAFYRGLEVARRRLAKPTLADKMAVSTDRNIDTIVGEISRAVEVGRMKAQTHRAS
jgi:hypothetical protein